MIGELSALGSAFSWALVSVLLRNLQYRINTISLNAFRSVVAALITFVVVIATGKIEELGNIPPQVLICLTVSVLLGLGLGDTIYFYSIKMVGVARGLPLSNAYPIFAAIIAFIWHGEPITSGFMMGTLLVIAGVILVLMPSRALFNSKDERGRNEKLGIILGLTASFLWACGTNVLKLGAMEVDSLVANTVRLSFAAVALTAVGGISRAGLQLREYRGQQLLGIGATGLISALSALTFLIALQNIGAAKTATLSSTAPLFGVPLSLLAGEKLTWQIVLGSVISVIGIWLVVSA